MILKYYILLVLTVMLFLVGIGKCKSVKVNSYTALTFNHLLICSWVSMVNGWYPFKPVLHKPISDTIFYIQSMMLCHCVHPRN